MSNPSMEFKYKHYSLYGTLQSEVTYTIHNVGTIDEFRHFLLSAGYAPNTVEEVIESD
jgi:hypothetical protein